MKKNPIKNFFSIFFSFKNPGRRIKKVAHTYYIAAIIASVIIASIVGIIMSGFLGLTASGALATGIADYTATEYADEIYEDYYYGNQDYDYYYNYDYSYYELYYSRYNEVFTPTLLISAVIICPIFCIIGFILYALTACISSIIALWFPTIMVYAFGELVENSKQKNPEETTGSNIEVIDQKYAPQEPNIYEPSPAHFQQEANNAEPEITVAEQETTFQPNIVETNTVVEDPAKSEPETFFSTEDEYQPIKKENTIPLTNNDPQLAEKLATALQFSTDTAMISYLRGLRNVQINQLLNLPNEEIRRAVVNLMDKENLKHKGWMCSCGAKNKPTARECSVCYKKREE